MSNFMPYQGPATCYFMFSHFNYCFKSQKNKRLQLLINRNYQAEKKEVARLNAILREKKDD